MYTDSHSASALTYQAIKSLVLLGDVPIGVRLREERLAERLKVSRTPVRESLLRLHAEHFLERHPEGGYRATNPSVQTMRELYEVRRALEIFALRHTFDAGVRDREGLRELRGEWLSLEGAHPSADAEFVHIDEDFHYRLAESAGNVQLVEQLRRISERIRPVRSHDFMTEGRIAATIEQHLAIVESLLSRRVGRAAELLDRHIGESQTVVEGAVAKVLERMLSIGERDPSW
jgi:DNA-binding GntR family transcriptional regulator